MNGWIWAWLAVWFVLCVDAFYGRQIGQVFYRAGMGIARRQRDSQAARDMIITAYMRSGDSYGLGQYLGYIEMAQRQRCLAARAQAWSSASIPGTGVLCGVPVYVPEMIIPLTQVGGPETLEALVQLRKGS